MRALVLAVGLFVITAPPCARASTASRIVYARTTTAEACPAESTFRAAVKRRLGYDPFFVWAPQTVYVEISRRRDGLAGKMRLIDQQGVVRGARELGAAPAECDELVEALALAVSITLDPRSATAEAHDVEDTAVHAADPQPTAAPITADPPRPAPPPTERASRETRAPPQPTPGATWTFAVRAGPLASLGVGPSPSLGGRLGIRVDIRRFALAAELRSELPTAAASELGGQAIVSTVAGALAPCITAGAIAGCALGVVGILRTQSQGLPRQARASMLYAAGGARAETTFRLGASSALVFHADALKTLTLARIYLNEAEVWQTPPFSFTLGAALGLDFF